MANNYNKQIADLNARVSELEDVVEKMRRDLNDTLFNLEEENFTPEFLNKLLNKS